jgi:hypothetical protein
LARPALLWVLLALPFTTNIGILCDCCQYPKTPLLVRVLARRTGE